VQLCGSRAGTITKVAVVCFDRKVCGMFSGVVQGPRKQGHGMDADVVGVWHHLLSNRV